MAAALILSGAVKAVQSYEEAQGQISQAKDERALGYQTANANEDRVRSNSALSLGEQRAKAVQSGFDANSGSMATLQGQSAGNAELDALNERYKGQLTAWRADQQIKNAQAQLKGGATIAAASLLGGAAMSYFGGAALGAGASTTYAGSDVPVGSNFA